MARISDSDRRLGSTTRISVTRISDSDRRLGSALVEDVLGGRRGADLLHALLRARHGVPARVCVCACVRACVCACVHRGERVREREIERGRGGGKRSNVREERHSGGARGSGAARERARETERKGEEHREGGRERGPSLGACSGSVCACLFRRCVRLCWCVRASLHRPVKQAWQKPYLSPLDDPATCDREWTRTYYQYY